MSELVQENNKYRVLIWILSVAIPVVVAILIFTPQKLALSGGWVDFLPHLNGILNSTTAVLLVIGLIFIKSKNIGYHKLCMSIAFTLGALFLVSYVIYHAAADSTIFGDANFNGTLEESEKEVIGGMRILYLVILLSHIVLAAIVVPFVLFAFYFALTNKIERHKKIVKFTFPIWLYVSITGVVVYLMISPYYG